MKLNIKKKVLLLAAGLSAAASSAFPVMAADTGVSSVETALTTSFTSVGSSITSLIGKVLPIALPIIGAGVLIFVGIKIFKRVTNKV